MKCFKNRSTLTLSITPQPQQRPQIKTILTYSATLDDSTLKTLKKKRLCVQKLERKPNKLSLIKERKQLKKLRSLTHLKVESPTSELFRIFAALPNSLVNLRKLTTDIHKGKYDMKMFVKFLSRMKRLSSLEDIHRYEPIRYRKDTSPAITIYIPLNSNDTTQIQKSRFYIYKKVCSRNLSVTIHTTVEDFLFISRTLQRFIHRTHSNVAYYARNIYTHQYLTLLSLIEDKYRISEPSMFLGSVSYNFHQRLEMQERIISHLTMTWPSLKEIVLFFEVNSTNWFAEQRIENWKKMAELIVARMNSPQAFKVRYNIKFNNYLHKDTLQDILTQMGSLIQLCSQNQAKNYVEVNMELDFPRDESGLESFVERVLKTMGRVNKISGSHILEKYCSLKKIKIECT